ncbi:putative tetrahydroberberine oxidase [Lupinus albus]|uniref:Putative tetrahydroberberine oxidase n=1 Tax=Lupinus albus TaxID=3870 RepID=A0A6A4QSP1_LUPAL|nr:putative tetrahydroberberine oxidase [Lupinus albus]
MGYHWAFLILLLSISCSASTLVDKSFKQCMLTRVVGSNSTSIERIVLNSSSSQYTQALDSLIQNPRWLNSSRKPFLIITPIHEPEILAAIACSSKLGLQIRVRSGGHDYEGLSYLANTPFVMLDLVNVHSIAINLTEETAWVQAGTTLGELYYRISQVSNVHGFPAGLCPGIGLGGHISGGGFGTMLRKYGIAADNVLDAHLIDKDGTVRDRKAMGEDLFWAIRGGSATSFGVILKWKIRLVKVPAIVTAFTIQRTLEEGATKLIHRWQQITDKLNPDLFIRVVAQNSGANSKTVTAIFNSFFLGGIDRLIPIVKASFPELGLQAKDCIEMSWIQSVLYFGGHSKEDPPEVLLQRTKSNSFFKGKSDFVKVPIPENGLEGIWKMLLSEDTLALMIMEPFGGRMNEIPEPAIPFPHRKGNLYNIQYMVIWEEKGIEVSNKHVKWMRMLYEYMTPYVSKSPRAAYLNYRDLDLGTNKLDNISYTEASVWGEKYFKGNFRRLAEIKTKSDPVNFFRSEQSIPLLR